MVGGRMETISQRILISAMGGGLIPLGLVAISKFTKPNVIVGIITIIIGIYLICKARCW